MPLSYQINYSIVKLKIKFTNTGCCALDCFKLSFGFESDKIKLLTSNIEDYPIKTIPNVYRNFCINKNNIIYNTNRSRPILLPSEKLELTIYIELPPVEFNFSVSYNFLSKEYNNSDELICRVMPKIQEIISSRASKGEEKEGILEKIISKKEYIEL